MNEKEIPEQAKEDKVKTREKGRNKKKISKKQGENIGVHKVPTLVFEKSLPAHGYVRLCIQETSEYREGKKVGKGWIIGGEHTVRHCIVTLKRNDSQNFETIWEKKESYPKSLEAQPMYELKMVVWDVGTDGNSIYIAYRFINNRLVIDKLNRGEDGRWSISASFEVCREYTGDGDFLTTAQFIHLKKALYLMADTYIGAVRLWSLAGKQLKLVWEEKEDK